MEVVRISPARGIEIISSSLRLDVSLLEASGSSDNTVVPMERLLSTQKYLGGGGYLQSKVLNLVKKFVNLSWYSF